MKWDDLWVTPSGNLDMGISVAKKCWRSEMGGRRPSMEELKDPSTGTLGIEWFLQRSTKPKTQVLYSFHVASIPSIARCIIRAMDGEDPHMGLLSSWPGPWGSSPFRWHRKSIVSQHLPCLRHRGNREEHEKSSWFLLVADRHVRKKKKNIR